VKETSKTTVGFKPYLVTAVVVMVLLFALVALVNLWVDPFVVYRAVSSRRLDTYRDEIGSRTSKAELIKLADYDVLVLGSSRTEVGIDPLHPAWGGKKVYNIGLPSSNISELQCVLNYAHATHRAQSVVLFCDFSMWGPPDTNGDFTYSRFNSARSPIEYHIVNLVGLRSLAASARVIARWYRDDPTIYTPQGRRRHLRLNRTVRAQFDKYTRRYLARMTERGDYRPRPDYLAKLKDMLRSCRENGVDVVVVILPYHAVWLETYRIVGLWPIVEDWKRQLVTIVEQERGDRPTPVWDFFTYNRYTTESVPISTEDSRKMKWFWDPSHCRSELGDKVLEKMLGEGGEAGPYDDFGTLLTSENIDAHLARGRTAREEYARAFPHEVERVAQIADEGHRMRRRYGLGAAK